MQKWPCIRKSCGTVRLPGGGKKVGDAKKWF